MLGLDYYSYLRFSLCQRDGISWIRFLQSVNLNGALCDDMGLGKTLQALVGIGLAHCQKISNDNNKHSNEVIKSLVVCPSTLCGHWFNEITRFFSIGQFYQVLRHDGNSKKRKSSWRLGINTANIIVTSYSVLRQDIDILSSVMWTYCILDEGHLLKNPKTGEPLSRILFLAFVRSTLYFHFEISCLFSEFQQPRKLLNK